ncbi:PTS sugar transporter subunit IIB [Pandoraea terrae]|uniref:PTS sugar transporter subunit IIB n=1 Tax=Pandoraea terrae TaxID=1537710 RepID=A0A5E4YDG5_9BURK|nr:PTS sugar transporter subunit IIA [Pandoraea terrae]VVE46203.1 PTS sugar transporter subunit IIB [Pandoraea terrae]
MAGILIIAHAPYASAMRECVTHIYGGCPARIGALDVSPDQDTAALLDTARERVEHLREENGVLVLTDLFGATPSNIAAQLVGRDVRVLAGANLPMLIKAVCYRSVPLDTLVDKVLSGGSHGILQIGACAPANQTTPR